MQLGRNDEARIAFDRAIALANTSAEAAHIRMHHRSPDPGQPAEQANGGARQGERSPGSAGRPRSIPGPRTVHLRCPGMTAENLGFELSAPAIPFVLSPYPRSHSC